MTSHDDHTDETSGRDPVEDLLSQALTEEADTVEQTPGALQSIQRRTAGSSPSSRKPWLIGSVGAGLAAAAVITAVVLIGGSGAEDAGPPIATPPTDSTPTDSTPTDTEPNPGIPIPPVHGGQYDPSADASHQFMMYYLGASSDDPQQAPRLYAETHTVSDPGSDPKLTALNELLTSTPIDPDYSAQWEGLYATGISKAGGVTTVDLVGTQDKASLGIVDHSYPLGYFATESNGLQALLRTIGATGPVTFTYNFEPVDMFMLQPLPVSPAPDDAVRAWISIDNIVDGQAVTNPVTVKISGNVFEGTVNYELHAGTGQQGICLTCDSRTNFVTTSMGTWTQADVDLGTLDPGTYTFVAYEISPKDGSKLNVDSKTFHVE